MATRLGEGTHQVDMKGTKTAIRWRTAFQRSMYMARYLGALTGDTLPSPLTEVRPHAKPDISGRDIPDGGAGRRVTDIVKKMKNPGTQGRRNPWSRVPETGVAPNILTLDRQLGDAEAGRRLHEVVFGPLSCCQGGDVQRDGGSNSGDLQRDGSGSGGDFQTAQGVSNGVVSSRKMAEISGELRDQ